MRPPPVTPAVAADGADARGPEQARGRHKRARSKILGIRIGRLRVQAGLSPRDLADAGAREPSREALCKFRRQVGRTTALYLEIGLDDAVCPHCERCDREPRRRLPLETQRRNI